MLASGEHLAQVALHKPLVGLPALNSRRSLAEEVRWMIFLAKARSIARRSLNKPTIEVPWENLIVAWSSGIFYFKIGLYLRRELGC